MTDPDASIVSRNMVELSFWKNGTIKGAMGLFLECQSGELAKFDSIRYKPEDGEPIQASISNITFSYSNAQGYTLLVYVYADPITAHRHYFPAGQE
jgi:hypothetical protein